jgi:hypothetical protein
MLDRLAELRAAPDAIRLQKQALIDTVLTDEIRAKLAEIEAEFAEPLQVAEASAAALEAEIKNAVIFQGATVKGSALMAVWNKPRVTWDNSKLDGLMLAFPQLAGARKEGDPSVTIRKV